MTSINIHLVGYQPEQSVHTRAAKVFAAKLEEQLGDQVTFQLEKNVMDSGRKSLDVLTLVESGERNMGYFATSYMAARFPELAVLDLPFLVNDRQTAYRCLDGELGTRLKEHMEARSGYRVLGFWDNGFRHISNRVRPIRSPEDCRGLKMRTGDSQLHQTVFRQLGFDPVYLDVRDLIKAVESGEIDAQDNSLTNIYNFGFRKHHRFITLSGHFLGAVAVLCNGEAFASWPGEIQAAVQTAVDSATAAQRQFAIDEDEQVLAKLSPDENEVIELTQVERAAFADAVRDVVAEQSEILGHDLVGLLAG